MTLLFNFYDLSIAFIEFYILFLLVHLCYPRIFPKFLTVSFILSNSLAFTTLVFDYFSISYFYTIFFLFMLPAVFMWIFFHIPLLEAISITTFYFFCIEILDYLNLLFLSYITKNFDNGLLDFQGMTWNNVINNFVMKIILFFLYYLIRQQLTKRTIQTCFLKYLLFITIPGSIILYYLGLKIYTFVNKTISLRSILFLFLFLITSVLLTLYSLYKNQLKEMELITLSNTILSKSYEELQTLYETRAKDFHDFKHHLDALHFFAQNQNSEEIQKYIEDLYVPLKLRESTIYSNNQIVDCILNTKYNIAKLHNISFEVTAEIPPKFPITSTDICIILGNILDNAIEANLRLSKQEKRWIKFLIRCEHNMVYILVKNSCQNQKKQSLFTSTKENQFLHGWGIKSIQTTLKKYHGHMEYSFYDNYFEITILLFL